MNGLGIRWIAGAAVLASAAAAAPGLTPEQELWLGNARMKEKAGWIYLHVEGGPRERGFQHGYLLAGRIAECLRVTGAMWRHQSGMEWPWLTEQTRKFINPAIDRENMEEIGGIAEGMSAAGVAATSDELITYNASLELTGYWWPKEKKRLAEDSDGPKPKKQSCSSFIATGRMTAGGGIVLGHNTMFDYADANFNVIIDIAPARGHRILMQTQPGWVHSGTDFFITDAGIVGSETTIGGFDGFSQAGIPEFARMRRATQDADGIDGWCAVMRKGNNGGYANAWLIGDVKTGEIARLELGLKYVGFERTRDGYFVGSNVPEDLRILRMETDVDDVDIRDSGVARRVRWKQLMRENAGRIDVERAKSMEADCYDTCLNKVNPSGRTLAGHFELDEPMYGKDVPYDPSGTFDAKVVDSAMARRMAFAARWGSADGTSFDAAAFLRSHPQFDWQEGILKSRPAEPWVEFEAGER
jgi:hypothetical protein